MARFTFLAKNTEFHFSLGKKSSTELISEVEYLEYNIHVLTFFSRRDI